jgi:hypothetical protein
VVNAEHHRLVDHEAIPEKLDPVGDVIAMRRAEVFPRE